MYKIITPVELKHLKQLRVFRESVSEGALACEIVLCDQNEQASITVLFEGLSQFAIAKTSGTQMIGPLKALDVRDRQWENIKYQVRDYEDEFVSFYCKTFSLP